VSRDTLLNVFNASAKTPPVSTAATDSLYSDTERKGSPTEKTGRGNSTREQILDTAIGLFREKGFDETTMREVAREAGVALGLAYHYFPGKEALVMAYYERVQQEHRLVVEEKLPQMRSLHDRLAMLLDTKLDILKDDRKLLGALFRYTGNPDHPLSFLGKSTAYLREDCIDLFAEVLGDEKLPDDLREVLPLALWSLHMGILLYLLYDASPNLKRTHRLAEGSVRLVVTFLKLVKLPVMRPARKGVITLLRDAGLVGEK
jgi:AcrR family transcriptional regulator